jgi:hypothetical protein
MISIIIFYFSILKAYFVKVTVKSGFGPILCSVVELEVMVPDLDFFQ